MTFIAKNKDTVLKNPLQVYQPITNLSEQNFTIHCYKIPETETSEIPEEIDQTTTESPQTQIPEEIDQTTTESPQTQIPEEIDQTATESPQTTTRNSQPRKIMQLRIPLLPHTPVTQTQETVTQETIQQNVLTVACNQTIPPEDVQPIFNDLIPEETYHTIVRELRQDPDLAKLMDDIELNMGDDIDMMDVDLPLEDDRLEQELYNLW